MMIIRQWQQERRKRSTNQREFHELEDDDDNRWTGRLGVSFSASSDRVRSDDGSTNDPRADTTPILFPTDSFTKFWNLTIPIMTATRPHRRRSRVTATTSTKSSSCTSTTTTRSTTLQREPARSKSWNECHHSQEQDAVNEVNMSQEWREASKYLSSIVQPASITQPQQVAPLKYDKKGLQYPSVSPPQSQHRAQPPIIDTSSPSLPFNAGCCSTIVPSTPETRYIPIRTNSSSPIEPNFTPSPVAAATTPPNVTPSPPRPPGTPFVNSSPQNYSPFSPAQQVSFETKSSDHSNPPYIPPVRAAQIVTSGKNKGNPAVLVVSPDETKEAASVKQVLNGTYQSPSSNIVRIKAQVNPNPPPPLEFWIAPSAQRTMDDVSSLGGDSIGETPTRIIACYSSNNHQEEKNNAKTASNTMETTTQSSNASGKAKTATALRYCCCLACLPSWIKRQPTILKYALFVGSALWIFAAALVAIAVVVGKSNNNQHPQSSVAKDWTETWTLPPTPAPVYTASMTSSLVPTLYPTSSAQPSLPPVPTTSPSLAPIGSPTRRPTFMPSSYNEPTGSPTMRPTYPPVEGITSRPTQFPTFAPKAMMGMRRDRSNRSRRRRR